MAARWPTFFTLSWVLRNCMAPVSWQHGRRTTFSASYGYPTVAARSTWGICTITNIGHAVKLLLPLLGIEDTVKIINHLSAIARSLYDHRTTTIRSSWDSSCGVVAVPLRWAKHLKVDVHSISTAIIKPLGRRTMWRIKVAVRPQHICHKLYVIGA